MKPRTEVLTSQQFNFRQTTYQILSQKTDQHQSNSHQNRSKSQTHKNKQNEIELGQLFQYSEKKILLLKGILQDDIRKANQNDIENEFYETSAKLLKALKKLYQNLANWSQDNLNIQIKLQKSKEEHKKKYLQLISRYKEGAQQMQEEKQKLEERIVDQDTLIKQFHKEIGELNQIKSKSAEQKYQVDQLLDENAKNIKTITELDKRLEEELSVIIKLQKDNELKQMHLRELNKYVLEKEEEENLQQKVQELEYTNDKQQRVIVSLKHEKELLQQKLKQFQIQKCNDINELKEQNEKLAQSSECKICYNRQINIMLPCGHCYCQFCIEQMQKLNKMICSFCHETYTTEQMRKIYF